MYKKYFEKIKLAIFDVDGTMVETADIWKKAITKSLENIQLSFDSDKLDEFTDGIDIRKKISIIIEYVDPKIKPDFEMLISSIHTNFLAELEKGELQEKPGLWDLIYELKTIRELKLAIYTNSDRIVTDAILKKVGLDEVFDLIIAGDDVKKKKPDPEGYKLVLKKFELKPEEAVVFEDSPIGARAAEKCKLNTFIIWNVKHSKKDYPEKCVDFLPDFAPIAKFMNMSVEEFYFGKDIGILKD